MLQAFSEDGYSAVELLRAIILTHLLLVLTVKELPCRQAWTCSHAYAAADSSFSNVIYLVPEFVKDFEGNIVG